MPVNQYVEMPVLCNNAWAQVPEAPHNISHVIIKNNPLFFP